MARMPIATRRTGLMRSSISSRRSRSKSSRHSQEPDMHEKSAPFANPATVESRSEPFVQAPCRRNYAYARDFRTNSMSARMPLPGVSTSTGGPAALIISLQHLRADLPLAQVGVAVRARSRRVARVVCVQQIDLARDREHPLDSVRELLAGRVGVAGVEAEADLEVGLYLRNAVPEAFERIETPGHGVLAARGVLEVDRDLGLEHLEAPLPSADALLDVIVCMPAVDDHRGRADLGGGVAGLLEDLARAVADVVPRVSRR